MAQSGARHHDLLEQSDHAIGEDDLHEFDWDAPRLVSERVSEVLCLNPRNRRLLRLNPWGPLVCNL